MQWCPIVIACLILFIIVILIEININKDAFTCSPSVPLTTVQGTIQAPTPAPAPAATAPAPAPAPAPVLTPTYTYKLNTGAASGGPVYIQPTSTSYGLRFVRGNLSIINKDGTTKWDSKTYSATRSNCALSMQGDGNFVIYDTYDSTNSVPLWAANATPSKTAMMRFDELNGVIEIVDTTNSNVLVRVPDYVVQKGMDIAGNDITHVDSSSIDDLKQKCMATTGCVAFNSGGYLKSNATQTVVNTSQDLYIAKWGVLPQYNNIMNIPVKSGILSGGSKGDVYLDVNGGIMKLAIMGGSFKIIFNNNIVWYTKTTTADHLDMQADGNLVLYDANNKGIWASNTARFGIPLALRLDGNRGYMQLIVADGEGVVDEYPKSPNLTTHQATLGIKDDKIPIPSINSPFKVTAKNGGASFVVDKGNIACLDKYGDVFFTSTNTDFGSNPWHLDMQMDGSLIMYVGTDNKPVWYMDAKGNYNAQAYYNLTNGALELYTWSGALITRVGGFCVPTGDYTAIPDTDAGGNDIVLATGSIDDMKNQCNQLLDCVGFNSSGYLKKDISKTAPYTGITLYSKQFITHYPYKKYTDSDSNGNDIKQVSSTSINDVRRQCDLDPNCVAFNYVAKDNIGYLKKAMASSIVPLSGVNLYVKDKDF